ncbi:hypothetical protein [Lactococcus allomyrinae]|uniref:hypothetical protein n=1 Tax=Lactococcus allomyrinae TaxID=2419773 RepID=UPI0013C52E92|nr:hypothetical protein [Lactococcus allomyrinae]
MNDNKDKIEVSKKWLKKEMLWFLGEAYACGREDADEGFEKLCQKLDEVLETNKNDYWY